MKQSVFEPHLGPRLGCGAEGLRLVPKASFQVQLSFLSSDSLQQGVWGRDPDCATIIGRFCSFPRSVGEGCGRAPGI